ncbi:MAG: ACT domain-containing protein [Proteobacteria bacterium]|nr:ACT domain-containing protein [Pseudomonadota bacterium]
MKLQVLSATFDYYSFSSLQKLRQQQPAKKFFICSVPDDYSLLVEVPQIVEDPALAEMESGDEITDFEEVETGWRCIFIKDQLPFNEIGIAAEITGSLAAAAISVLVMSGYRTDYFFIKADSLARAMSCLREAGHELSS